MTHHTFTFKETLSFGWEKTKEHYWFILTLAFICVLISGSVMFLPLINGITSFLISIAIIAISFPLVKGNTPTLKNGLEPFKTYKVVWHTFLASILCGIIIMLGFILLILPGIYLATRLKFYMYAIIENPNLRPVASLKRSMEITKGKFWKLFGLNILFVVINIIGLIPFGLGLLITVPTTVIGYTYVYKKLSPTVHKNQEIPEGAHLA